LKISNIPSIKKKSLYQKLITNYFQAIFTWQTWYTLSYFRTNDKRARQPGRSISPFVLYAWVCL